MNIKTQITESNINYSFSKIIEELENKDEIFCDGVDIKVDSWSFQWESTGFTPLLSSTQDPDEYKRAYLLNRELFVLNKPKGFKIIVNSRIQKRQIEFCEATDVFVGIDGSKGLINWHATHWDKKILCDTQLQIVTIATL